LDIKHNAQWAKWKGIQVVGTGDFTHPEWLSELKRDLETDPNSSGLYQVKDQNLRHELGEERAPKFLLSVETSHIYKQNDILHRIHIVTFAPDFETVEKIQQKLTQLNVNITSDGRPIMGLSCPEYMDVVLTINENCLIIPAHIWTPWFSMFGSMSGFNTLEDCFAEFSPFVYGIETGLSSDPVMNWRIREIDNRSILSFSDAHSPSKLGREATVFDAELSYQGIADAIKNPTNYADIGEKNKIISTIEFYPEEGKYHYTGHRNCQLKQSPAETARDGGICSSCGKKFTLGVMHRVEQLANRKVDPSALRITNDEQGVRWINTPKGLRPPYTMIVPLPEIIAEVEGVADSTKKVDAIFQKIVNTCGSEFTFLLETPLEEIKAQFGERMADAISRVRSGNIFVDPGYDGEFGKVMIFKEANNNQVKETSRQTDIFTE
jgi:uncharacterized protein (TIGR00375 family)